MCNSCSGLLHNSRQTFTKGPHCFEMNLDGLFGGRKECIFQIPNIGKLHADSNCSVCDSYRQQTVGGCKNKVPAMEASNVDMTLLSRIYSTLLTVAYLNQQ